MDRESGFAMSISASSSVSAASAPAPASEPAVKLRSACDSCSIAKVRCDKGQPKCNRCVNNNFTCFYSPSRRFGKHPLAKNAANEKWNRRPTRSPPEPAVAAPLEPMNYPPAFTVPPPSQTSCSNQDDPMDITAGIDIDYSTLSAINPLDECLPLWCQTESLDIFGPNEFQYSISTPHLQHPGDHFNSQHSLDGLQVSHISPNPASPCPIMGTAATIMPESLSSSTSGSGGTPNTYTSTPASSEPQEQLKREELPIHDCEARAMATLESLYYCKMIHAKMPGQQPPKHISNPMPSLDRMLHFNKNALATLTKLLDCRCAHQVHLALLCMSILSKALFWYKLAVSDRYNLGSKMESAVGGEADGPMAFGAAAHLPERGVRLTPINIGVFNLEEEDQMALIKNVLLREVQKMDAIADKMGDLGSVRDSGDDFNVNWFGLAREKFKAEIQDTVKKIRRFGPARTNSVELS